MLRSLTRLWAKSWAVVGAIVALSASSPALALGLGDVRLDSALNEPLRAEIVLLSATPEELDNLTVQMAAPEIYARYGLDRPAYLQSVRFRIVRSGRTDGNVVRLTSVEPITEPFLTFLVEASWSRGRLLREYTVLLDPPTFAPPTTAPVAQQVQPPVQTAPADSGQIARPVPQTSPAPAPSRPAAATPAPSRPAPAISEPADSRPFDTTPGGDMVVQRGDTLWSIASRNQPDNRLSINQTMLAIYEANPQAFEGNINRLSAGASLRIPSADEVFRITRADALAEVQRQNSAWQTTAGDAGPAMTTVDSGPSLELVPPDEDTLSDDSSGVYDSAELPAEPATATSSLDDIRIAEIEDLLADQQDGLVVISDNELTALRRELAGLRGEPLPEEPAPVDETPVDDVFGADDEIFVDEGDDLADPMAEDSTADDLAAETPAEPAPAPVVQPASTPQSESLLDTAMGLLQNFWMWIAGAVVLLLALLVFFVRRSAGGGDADASGMWTSLDEADVTSRNLRIPDIGDETIVVEESTGTETINEDAALTATMQMPPEVGEQTMPPQPAPLASDATIEQTFSSETALNLDQSDPIAEADFHMAYGLYDQAADLMNGALAVEPERTDLLAKLCEIYFVWGNRDAFIDAAERFKGLLAGAEDPEWDKTVIMGQQLAGDHALFSDAPAGATKEVDLAFGDESEAELDMDFAAPADADDVIDLGADAPGETADGLDFVFDEEESGQTVETAEIPAPEEAPLSAAFEDPEPSTREMPAIESPADSPTTEVPTAEFPAMEEATAEMPTVESSLDDTVEELAGLDGLSATAEMPSIGDEEATRLASLDDTPAVDATAEIDLDDLGLDLDGLGADLDSTAESEALNLDDLSSTGVNEALADAEVTGTNQAIEEAADLLDATGHTQVLPEDFAVETGTGTNVERALADDDHTTLASANDDEPETLLASLDDDGDDVEFAKTEALPDGAFDDSVVVPGSTDMDLDLDDLTAALKVSSEGDTVNQVREDATLEQPRPVANGDDTPTAAIAPEQLSDDLHDARTMTEVGTKLDLARAYVDMGDPSGARSILEEVLDEGDESQRQQAQQLIDSLPA